MMQEDYDMEINLESENDEGNIELEPELAEVGTKDFDKLYNRPSYNNEVMTHETNIPEVIHYQAGENITIEDNTISSTAGVKTSSTYATDLDSDGYLKSSTISLDDYPNANDAAFISKGTLNEQLHNITYGDPLENVQIGKNAYADTVRGVAIGFGANNIDSVEGVAIGVNATLDAADQGVVIGKNSYTIKSRCVAIGEDSKVNVDDDIDSDFMFSVGDSETNFTRRIINVKNPEKAQDAATKDYVDNTVTTTLSSYQEKLTAGNRISINSSNVISFDGMTILKYGTSTWQDFINAYKANSIVYCRASSNANPASGAQTRLAFMAYVNDETNPTNVEFQYYRSVSSHSASQQTDQVFIYKLTNASGGTWTVTTREAGTKIVAGTGLTSSYNNGVLTISLA